MTTDSASSASPLDQIFRKVDQARERPGYAIVRIDTRSREIVSGMALMRRMLGSAIETYELRLDTPVEIYDAVETMRIFGTQESASIGFRISVTARSAQALDIVRVLASVSESPHDRLMSVVRAAVKRAADRINAQSPDGLMANILAARETWQEEMQRTIADRTGLEVRFVFNPPPGAKPTSRAFTVRNHEMATRDAPHRVHPLVFTVTLEPNGQAVLDPLAPSDQIRIDRARQILGRQLPPEICLYDLWFDKGRVEGALRTTLSNGLRTTGFTVADLVLEPIAAPIAREEQIRCPVIWTGRAGRPIEFNVEAVIRSRREETGRFDALHIVSRKAWLQNEADSALRVAMHARDFEDLNLQEQRAVEEHVIRLLRDAARTIGQDIEPVVAEVLLPESGWLERELLELPPAKYPTRNPLIDAEFGITVELALRTLRTVIDRLRMRSDGSRPKSPNGAPDDFTPLIREEVERIVRDAVRVTMATVEAEDYFGNFEPWPLPGEVALPVATDGHVKTRLIRSIETALRQRLDIDFVEIALRRTDSGVGEIYKEILALNPIEVAVDGILTAASLGNTDDMGVNIRARAEIPDADKSPAMIHRRGSRPFDRAKVVKDVEAAVLQFLRYHRSIEIIELGKGAIARADGNPSLFVELRDYLREQILGIYGFPVRLDHVDPVFSDKIRAERERNDIVVEAEIVHTRIIKGDIDDMLRRVTARRASLDAQIATLRDRLAQTDIMQTEQWNRLRDEITRSERERDSLARSGVQSIAGVVIPPTLSHRSDSNEAPSSERADEDGDRPGSAPSDAADVVPTDRGF